MNKNFDEWNSIKKKTEVRNDIDKIYFKEREVWWMRLGLNIGFEEDGTGEEYARPAVIIKKYNPRSFLVIPLSTTNKRGKYYFPVGEIDGKKAIAILSQIRLIDSKRLVKSISKMDKTTFSYLMKEMVEANFDNWL